MKKLSESQIKIIQDTLEDYVKSYHLAHNEQEKRTTDYYCNQFLETTVKDVSQRGVFMDYYTRHKRVEE